MTTEAKEMAKELRAFARGESKPDAKDIRKLAKMVENGENKEAFKFMKSLDTFVREGIPEKVRSYIYLSQTKTRKIVPVIVKLKGCKDQIGDAKNFKPGEIFKAEYEFPGNMSEDDIGIALWRAQENLIRDLIEIEYGDAKTRRVK